MNTLSIEPNNGIRIQLANYYRIRTWVGGGEMWEHQNQLLIRQSLGEFFPKAMPTGNESVLFQHFAGGIEVCSGSHPVTSANPVPLIEMERLQAALDALKQKGSDQHCDPNAKKLIDAFRLPSPAKDPELYRLYGKGRNQRLIVLWGLEKEEGSAVAPQEAMNRIQVEKSGSLTWLWAVLGVLLITCIAWWILEDHKKKSGKSPLASSFGSPNATPPTGVLSATGTASEGEQSAFPKPSGPTALPPVAGSKLSPDQSANGLVPNHGGSPLSAPAPSTRAEPMAANTTSSPINNAAKPFSAQPSTGEGVKPNVVTPSGTPVLLDPKMTKPQDSPAVPASAAAPKLGVVSPRPTDPAKMNSDLASSPTATPATTKSSDSPLPQLAKSSTTKKSETLPDPKNESPSGIPPATGNPTAMPKSLTNPSEPIAPPVSPLNVEIVNGRTNTPPKDGKVEMLLSILARDSDSKPVNINTVTSWQVDGKPQLDAEGHPITSNGLPVQLPEGKHLVTVTGVTSDGRTVSAQADVNVDIAVRQESTVRLNQRSAAVQVPVPKQAKP
jgi:hypothetical protein